MYFCLVHLLLICWTDSLGGGGCENITGFTAGLVVRRERTCVVLCSDMCFKMVMKETLKQMDFRIVFFELLFLESNCNYVE